MKKYDINNVSEPNLFDEIFDYSKVPAITFEERGVELCRPKDIWITDTTFRDGQQARAPYDVDQIVQLFKLMSRLSGPKGVIRQSEFFLYSEKDRESIRKCQELGLNFPEITGWIRAVKDDFKLVKQLGLKETGILTSASDYHIYLKLKLNREKALNKYLEVVDAALAEGVIPRCHFEDITRADFYGFVIPFAQKLMERSKESGIPIKIRACDTMGFGLPYDKAILPRSVPKIFEALHKEAGVPVEQLEWHGHNDFHKVLVNGTTAWLYNCASVNGTLLGWGERTGNPPIEGLIMDYIALNGGDPEALGIDTMAITEIASYFTNVIGDDIADNYPFVGEHFNTTRAGIHADGAIKDERIYNIFDTGKLLGRPIIVSITDKSGVAGVALWLNNYFGLDVDRKLDKGHPGVKGIFEWVQEQYESNRVSCISTAEMLDQTKMHLPFLFSSDLSGIKIKAKKVSKRIIDKIFERHPEFVGMDPKQIIPALKEFIRHDAFANLAYVLDISGNLVADYICQEKYTQQYRDHLSTNFAERKWFKNCLDSKELVMSELFVSKILDTLCVTVARPIFTNSGDIVGVLAIDLDFEDLTKLVSVDVGQD